MFRQHMMNSTSCYPMIEPRPALYAPYGYLDFNANNNQSKDIIPGNSIVVEGFRLDINNQIGKGVFGTVYRVHLHRGCFAEKLCLKAQPFNEETKNQINEEMEVMKHIKATFGTQFLMTDILSFMVGNKFCFLMEELGCSLLKMLNYKAGPFDLQLIQTIGYQILCGVGHLHSIGMTHCDIKPSNILISSDHRGTLVKVSDFGNTCKTSDMPHFQFKNCVQATWYRPPEVYLGLPQNNKTDVWAIGCMFAEMYTGNPLFVTNNDCVLLANQHFSLTGLPSKVREGRFYLDYYKEDELTGLRPYTQQELVSMGKMPDNFIGPKKIFDFFVQIIPVSFINANKLI